jgi:uncharacterized protein
MNVSTLSRPAAGMAIVLLLGGAACWRPVRAGEAIQTPAPPAAAASASQDLAQRLRTYWFDAARAGHVPMLREFLASGYALNQRDGKGYTALILAAYHGHADAVELLMKAGADACAADQRGNTALMGALFKGEMRIAARLLDAPCNPDQRNAAGQTAAMMAALFGRAELLQRLKERGADLQAVDAAGNSAQSLLEGEVRLKR